MQPNILPWFENHTGGRKLRLLGLSDPQKWIKDIERTLWHRNTLHDAVRLTQKDTLGILVWEEKTEHGDMEAPVALLRSDTEIKWDKFFESGSNFERKWWWYDFAHRFLWKDAVGVKDRIWSVRIDWSAVDETQKQIWEEQFRVLEKALGSLLVYWGHDNTAHVHGLGLYWWYEDPSLWVNLFLNTYVDRTGMPSFANVTELMSAIFHRDMVEEMWEEGHPIMKSVESNLKKYLWEVYKITDKNLQDYWLSVVKYPMFSLIHSEDESPDSIISNLKSDFPTLDLSATEWWDACHFKNISLIIDDKWNTYDMPVRELRKIIIPWLRSRRNNLDNDIALYVAEKIWYSNVSSWDDILRISKARQIWMSDKVSWDDISNRALYEKLLDDIPIFLDGLFEWDIRRLREEYMMVCQAGYVFDFDISESVFLEQEILFNMRALIKNHKNHPESHKVQHMRKEYDKLLEEWYDVSEFIYLDWDELKRKEMFSKMRKVIKDHENYPEIFTVGHIERQYKLLKEAWIDTSEFDSDCINIWVWSDSAEVKRAA